MRKEQRTEQQDPGESTVTLEMVAKEAGVSPSTVSRILNGTAKVSEDKRRAVEAAIARTHFQPNAMARGLAKGRTMSIGVLTQFIDSPFYGEALRGVEDALAASSFIPLFVSGHWNLKDEVDRMSLLLGRRVDGVIILTGRLSDAQLIEYAQKTPIVITGRQLQAPNLLSMAVDDFQGGYTATKHLIDYGHTRIAYISGPADHPDALERLRGYKAAMEEAGLQVDSDLIAQADFHESGGAMAITQLINSRRDFTAVFAANDQMAYGARLALYRLNLRVPDDISLIGFDDLPTSLYATPPLSTIRQPVYEIGKCAAQAMLCLIEGRPYEGSLPPLELLIRETTRRLRR
ncbi:substrate-binding domain-containing protein [Massilia sp. W12]|uniref:LacI family DNA-binding transcriptional regulator n=1 Tax=Massilia sp. W12 TaxID=3126507 RepID=UPI0030D5A8CE